jgi:hypothetical protein
LCIVCIVFIVQEVDTKLKTVTMAANLLGEATGVRERLERNPRFLATEQDRQMFLAELNCRFLASQMKEDVLGVHAVLQQLRNAVGVRPEMLWSKAFMLSGVLLLVATALCGVKPVSVGVVVQR